MLKKKKTSNDKKNVSEPSNVVRALLLFTSFLETTATMTSQSNDVITWHVNKIVRHARCGTHSRTFPLLCWSVLRTFVLGKQPFLCVASVAWIHDSILWSIFASVQTLSRTTMLNNSLGREKNDNSLVQLWFSYRRCMAYGHPFPAPPNKIK